MLQSNTNLEAKLWIPENSQKAIVIAHSFRNSMDEPVCSEAAQEFSNKGYAVLSFNFLGHGNSGGSLRDVSYKTTSENLSCAIKYFRDRGFERVGVYAISLGTVATVLSKEHPDGQIFLSASPLYNPKGLLERYSKYIDREKLKIQGYCDVVSGSGRGSFQMGKEWIGEMDGAKGEVWKRHKKNKIKTLVIQGTKDELSRLKGVKSFVGFSDDEYLEIKGADHNFTNPSHRKKVIANSINWFNNNL